MPTTMDYDNDSNDEMACFEESFELDRYLIAHLPPIQAVVFTIYFILGALLNGFVVYLVVKFKNLLTDSVLAIQVVAVDILFVLCLPFAMGTLMGGSHLLVPAECYIMGFIKLYLNFVRFMMMLVISIDRFSLVFFPFAYPTYRKKISTFLAIIVRASAALVASFPLIIDCYGYMPTFGFCMMVAYCSPRCWGFSIGVVSAMMSLGGVFPIALYSLMFCKARRMAKLDIMPQDGSHRWLATYLLLLVTLIGCSVPLIIAMVFWEQLYYPRRDIFWVYFGLSMTAFEAIVVADPIMIMRNRDVRIAIETVKRQLRKKCCHSF